MCLKTSEYVANILDSYQMPHSVILKHYFTIFSEWPSHCRFIGNTYRWSRGNSYIEIYFIIFQFDFFPIRIFLWHEPVHNKTCNKTWMTSELRSACTSAQSDQSLCWLHVPSTACRLSKEGWKRTLGILGGCTGWSVFAGHTGLILGFVVCWFCSALAQISVSIFTLNIRTPWHNTNLKSEYFSITRYGTYLFQPKTWLCIWWHVIAKSQRSMLMLLIVWQMEGQTEK